MAHKQKNKLQRVTLSLDPGDYAEFLEMSDRAEVSASWLIRLAMREFLDRYGEQGQPQLMLRVVQGRRGS